MADVTDIIDSSTSHECIGIYFIDEDLLKREGKIDFSKFAVTTGMKVNEIKLDFYI